MLRLTIFLDSGPNIALQGSYDRQQIATMIETGDPDDYVEFHGKKNSGGDVFITFRRRNVAAYVIDPEPGRIEAPASIIQ